MVERGRIRSGNSDGFLGGASIADRCRREGEDYRSCNRKKKRGKGGGRVVIWVERARTGVVDVEKQRVGTREKKRGRSSSLQGGRKYCHTRSPCRTFFGCRCRRCRVSLLASSLDPNRLPMHLDLLRAKPRAPGRVSSCLSSSSSSSSSSFLPSRGLTGMTLALLFSFSVLLSADAMGGHTGDPTEQSANKTCRGARVRRGIGRRADPVPDGGRGGRTGGKKGQAPFTRP